MDNHEPILNEHGEISKAGCIVVRQGKILFLLTKDSKPYLPKGHVEKDETLEMTAVRETQEETGFAVNVVQQLGDMTYNHGETGAPIRVTYFLAVPNHDFGEPEDQLVWLSIGEVAPNIQPNVTDFLRAHEKQILSV